MKGRGACVTALLMFTCKNSKNTCVAQSNEKTDSSTDYLNETKTIIPSGSSDSNDLNNTSAPSTSPTPVNKTSSPTLHENCMDVNQEGYIVDNLSWDMDNHTGSDNINRSINPDEVTKTTLVDSSSQGYGLLVQDGNGEYEYRYNFTTLGNEITMEYLYNEDEHYNQMIHAIGLHCFHNDTFLLGNIKHHKEDEHEDEPDNGLSRYSAKLTFALMLASAVILTSLS